VVGHPSLCLSAFSALVLQPWKGHVLEQRAASWSRPWEQPETFGYHRQQIEEIIHSFLLFIWNTPKKLYGLVGGHHQIFGTIYFMGCLILEGTYLAIINGISMGYYIDIYVYHGDMYLTRRELC
jgi:hypothetical protein